jgi:hypothetical protein
MTRKRIVPFILAAFFLLLPAQASAQSSGFLGFQGPILPEQCKCTGQPGPDGTPLQTAPDFGCVLQVAQNVLNLVVSLAVVAMTLWIAYAGWQLIVSGGNPQKLKESRSRFINIAIGLLVVLAAWLIVDFVMKSLYRETSFGPWNAILADPGANYCIVAQEPKGIISGTLDVIFGPPGSSGGGTSPRANDGSGGNVGSGSGSADLNVNGAVSWARRNAHSRSQGDCALYVRRALGEGGNLAVFKTGRGHAYQFGTALTQAGFTRIHSGTYSSASEQLAGLRPGDVVVFQRVAGHPYGHVAIYDGQWWISDYVQRTMSSNPQNYQGGSFAIYRP